MLRNDATGVPVAPSTTATLAACGSIARTETVPPTTCMPRTANGSPWRALTMDATSSSAGSDGSRVGIEDSTYSLQRYAQPRRPIRKLVRHLVERFFEHEKIQQLLRHFRI